MKTDNAPKKPRPGIKIDFDFYKSNANVPIEQLAEHLGMRPDIHGKFLCPCHKDTHPSMVITKSGKYENKFHCYSCGESGDPILLVMAVRSGINPSVYWSDPSSYKEQRLDAVRFIDTLYPGGLKTIGIKEKEDPNAYPIITNKMLCELGLNENFFRDCFWIEDKTPGSGTQEYLVDMGQDALKERTLILMDKINDYIEENVDEKYLSIIRDFPKLNTDARSYIRQTLADKAEQFQTLYDKLQNYLDHHYTNLPWLEEETER